MSQCSIRTCNQLLGVVPARLVRRSDGSAMRFPEPVYLCPTHHAEALAAGLLEVNMPPISRPKAGLSISLRANPQPGQCRVDGCTEPPKIRGLCKRDYNLAFKAGRLEELGGPADPARQLGGKVHGKRGIVAEAIEQEREPASPICEEVVAVCEALVSVQRQDSCPKCGGGITWSHHGKPGELGYAECIMHKGYIKAELRRECHWTGYVIRLEDLSVRIATDDEVAAAGIVQHPAQPPASEPCLEATESDAAQEAPAVEADAPVEQGIFAGDCDDTRRPEVGTCASCSVACNLVGSSPNGTCMEHHAKVDCEGQVKLSRTYLQTTPCPAPEGGDVWWTCQIGPVPRDALPGGCDVSLRLPVEDAFVVLTGRRAAQCFSGWEDIHGLEDPTGKHYLAHLAMSDIREAILGSGHPLGDDSDPELTPLRLVREVLEELAHARAQWSQLMLDHEKLSSQRDAILAALHAPEGVLPIQWAADVWRERGEASTDLEICRRLLGQILVATTLAPGERLEEPIDHATVQAVVRLVEERNELRRAYEAERALYQDTQASLDAIDSWLAAWRKWATEEGSWRAGAGDDADRRYISGRLTDLQRELNAAREEISNLQKIPHMDKADLQNRLNAWDACRRATSDLHPDDRLVLLDHWLGIVWAGLERSELGF